MELDTLRSNIMLLIDATPDGFTIAEIAERTNGDISTVESCIRTLEESRGVVKSGLRYYSRCLFVCESCDAGPWHHGSTGSTGAPIESFHIGHALRNVK